MILELSPVEFNTFFILTIILLGSKIIIALYLGLKIYQRKQETGEFSYGFIFAVFIMIICLFASRFFYMIFDFVLTRLDPSAFYLLPNNYFWKIAVVISAFGYAFVLFIIDRDILEFKFKGVLSYILFGVSLVIFFIPVNSEADFGLVSSLLFIINIIAIALPILFFYIGIKEEQYRSPAFLIAVGVIIYAIGANILVETIVAFFDNLVPGSRIFVYFLSLILKISGISLFAYGVSAFSVMFSN